jgi:hypothetical protein
MYSTHSTLTYPTLCRRGPKALRAPPKPPTISSDPYSGSECENLTGRKRCDLGRSRRSAYLGVSLAAYVIKNVRLEFKLARDSLQDSI